MQISTSASIDKRRIYLEERIKEEKESAINLYNELKEESKNITSLYTFNRKVDKLSQIISEILYFIEMLELYIPTEEIIGYKRMTREEIAEEEKERLVRKRAAVVKTISSTDQAISSIKDDTYLLRLQNKLEMERLRSTLQLERINSELRVYEGDPDLTDGEIDIYFQDNEQQIYFKGQIFLHNTPVMIGNIEYRGPNNGPWLGDIGYTIEQPFRGHNYAYKALKLIKEKIIASGIDNVIITTDIDNIPSQRTIEKFGGKKIESTLEHVVRYRCNLSLELEEQHTIKM